MMHQFKIKSKKKVYDKRATVNEIHEQIMDDFKKEEDNIDKYQIELGVLKESIIKLEAENKYSNSLDNLKDQFKELDTKIQQIQTGDNINKYLTRVAGILLKISEHDSQFNKSKKKAIENGDSIGSRVKAGINKYIDIYENTNKGDLLEEYLCAVDNIIYVKKDHNQQTKLFFCDKCNVERIFNNRECLLVCPKCGIADVWQDPDMPQWSDEVDVSKNYKYKRLGYFIEHLYRMQAQECAIIPDHVIHKLMVELRTRRITNPQSLNPEMIKQYLKALNLTNYYENVNSIIRTLSGKHAPKFPEDVEDKLVMMFMQSLPPFEKYKHLIPYRSNYLSYPYAIRKLIKIISYNENNDEILKFVDCFSLLKSRQKLWDQENVWKKICEENNWPFFKSI
jgi:hypothetical protein